MKQKNCVKHPYILNTRKHHNLFILTEIREISQKKVDVHKCMRDDSEMLSNKTLPLQYLLMAVTKM